ncbi:hypothetical protein E2C01_048888 [Portunus trituberculatus]|uniref:Uncharacterized protein n=1 Tax=Portunus trituberculatus TaxID=210409 RepID=A0A5B7GCQ9_PORTR|nr:hypothetical protein [Portunus trituberculatus]
MKASGKAEVSRSISTSDRDGRTLPHFLASSLPSASAALTRASLPETRSQMQPDRYPAEPPFERLRLILERNMTSINQMEVT